MDSSGSVDKPSILQTARRRLIGAPRDFHEPSVFHKISLIPILAWIGLGADGLSSSSYGPEEAFKALGHHTYLAAWLAIATALTIIVISYSYSRIIEHFPHGGGGYLVASHTISRQAGVLSGSALLVDYVLTITVSLASCSDALFSFLPVSLHAYPLHRSDKGVSEISRLFGKGRVPPGEPLPQTLAQRHGVCHPAPAAVGRNYDGDTAGARELLRYGFLLALC
jgi:hypothetical protein